MKATSLSAVRLPDEIAAPELARLVAALPPTIKILSLDCFDTILWRDVAAPTDVFFDLQHREPMRRHGLSAAMRMRAEASARELRRVRDGRTEVSLSDIYRAALPAAQQSEIEALMQAEIDEEARACRAFPATVDLIRAARARGLKVIVVSDTYLGSAQLRHLLERCLPADAFAAIHRVYCSSEAGVSKAGGLFAHLLSRINVAPGAIVHLGDNPVADFKAPRALGLHAVRLVQHDPRAGEIDRLIEATAGLMLPSIRAVQSLPLPYRGVTGAHTLATRTPAEAFGYLALGPVMHAYARFLREELEALESEGRPVRLAFLMRDGHLPELAYRATTGSGATSRIAVSRFVSYGASFRSAEDIHRYLAPVLTSRRWTDIARQLLLSPQRAEEIVARAECASDPEREFSNQVMRRPVMDEILAASAALRARLIRYLQRETGLQHGDTLVFADLGYEGTAQRQLAPVLADELGVRVIGRYLIAAPTPGWQRERTGLIDASGCDERALRLLVKHVALLETMCTAAGSSVVDYDENGAPCFGPSITPAAQLHAIQPVQAACVEFVRDAQTYFSRSGESLERGRLADYALLALARMLFAPTAEEIGFLEGFQLDIGLGTDLKVGLFDIEEGLRGLRRRGLFYMERNLESLRINHPHELRFAGFENAVSALAQERFSLSISAQDLALRKISMPVIAMRGEQVSRQLLDAHATHDGWYALLAPLGGGDIALGIQIGERYEAVQIDSVEMIPASRLHSNRERTATVDILERVSFDEVEVRPGGLCLCASRESLLVIAPPGRPPGAGEADHLVCRVVFRPISLREPDAPEGARESSARLECAH